jgi:hypothetical protein
MLMFARALAHIALGGVFVVGVSGCGLSTFTSGLGGGVFGGSSSRTAESKEVTNEHLLEAVKADSGLDAAAGEVAHDCPRFQVWSRDNHLTIYDRGRAGDPLGVMHRGEIVKTARECTISPGRVVVKYGFSGRVLLGPSGKAGTVTLPVNIFVTDAKRERLATDKMKVDVAITADRPIGYFSMVRTVSFAIPEGARPGEFDVFVGFDRNAPGAG